MADITRRTAVASGMMAALARRARAQPGRNILVGGFDVGPGGYPNNFNPLAATAGFTWFNLYYETLLSYDAALTRIGPALASSVEAAPDGLGYTFRLVPDAKWHDGTAFTAADVAFTLELARDTRAGSVFAARLADVAAVDTPDAATVVVRLGKPNASFADTLTRLMMLPRHALSALPREGLDRSSWWSRTPLGTGPFQFVRYETDQFVELKANLDYRLGRPKLDGLINRYFRNTAAAVAAQRAGEIQFTYVEPDDLKPLQADRTQRVIAGDSWVVNYLGFNHMTPYWRDVRVRRAVMHAINRDAIVKSVLGGTATVANSAFVAANVVPPNLDPYAYDPARARALLGEAGWSGTGAGKTLPLLTYYNTPLVANLLAAVQAMLGQVGIAVAPRQVDVPTFNSVTMVRDADSSQFALVYGGAINGPDPGGINPYLNERQIPPNGNNSMRVRIPALNAALDAAQAEPDADRRLEHYRQAAHVQNSELPWGFMWVTKRFGVVSAAVQDFVWTPAPGGGCYDQQAHRWALATG